MESMGLRAGLDDVELLVILVRCPRSLGHRSRVALHEFDHVVDVALDDASRREGDVAGRVLLELELHARPAERQLSLVARTDVCLGRPRAAQLLHLPLHSHADLVRSLGAHHVTLVAGHQDRRSRLQSRVREQLEEELGAVPRARPRVARVDHEHQGDRAVQPGIEGRSETKVAREVDEKLAAGQLLLLLLHGRQGRSCRPPTAPPAPRRSWPPCGSPRPWHLGSAARKERPAGPKAAPESPETPPDGRLQARTAPLLLAVPPPARRPHRRPTPAVPWRSNACDCTSAGPRRRDTARHRSATLRESLGGRGRRGRGRPPLLEILQDGVPGDPAAMGPGLWPAPWPPCAARGAAFRREDGCVARRADPPPDVRAGAVGDGRRGAGEAHDAGGGGPAGEGALSADGVGISQGASTW
eukprot:scaffold395_cov243-Pinguiococcus_pyrenoidosus.AAC.38